MAGLEILMRFITLLGYVGVLLLLVYYVINGRCLRRCFLICCGYVRYD